MTERELLRASAMAAFIALGLGGVAGALHPRPHDFADHPRGYLELAGDHPVVWFVVHLGLIAGALTLATSIGGAALSMINDRSGLLARLGVASGPANMAIIVVFFAVDGIAIKDVAERWVDAKPAQRADAFYAAAGVERVADSLQSLLAVTLGIAIFILGLTIVKGLLYPTRFGLIGVGVGTLNAASGILLAGVGTRAATIYFNLVGTLLCFAWQAAFGVLMLRRARELEGAGEGVAGASQPASPP